MSKEKDPQDFLAPTYYFDHEHPRVRAFIEESVGDAVDAVERAVKLYYAVRDGIRYDPYRFYMRKEYFTASRTLIEGAAYCVPKANLLTAVARGAGIPARVGFADVRNHLSTERMRQMMKTDLFVWHGYTDILLEGRWLKATPAFNLALCERFGLLPLEFDGSADSIYHPFDRAGNRHMEYVHQRGAFDDLPLAQMAADFAALYPGWAQDSAAVAGALARADFMADVNREAPEVRS